MLKHLKLENVGPSSAMELEFGERLNLITGDNGLGKSFLLDIAWWSMTRKWAFFQDSLLDAAGAFSIRGRSDYTGGVWA